MTYAEIEILLHIQRTGRLPMPGCCRADVEKFHVERMHDAGLIQPRAPDYAEVRHTEWNILPRGEAYLHCLLAMPLPTASTVWSVDTKPVHDILERNRS